MMRPPAVKKIPEETLRLPMLSSTREPRLSIAEPSMIPTEPLKTAAELLTSALSRSCSA